MISYRMSTQIKPSQSFADARWTHYKYSLHTFSTSANAITVANAFMKSNCTPARSAAVERLFSAFAQVLIARRCRMQDKTLDMRAHILEIHA